MSKNLIVSRNPARKRKRRTTAKQRAAARRNIKKAQAARRRGSRRRRTLPRRTRRRRNPTARRRSNPRRPTVKGIINNQVMPALVGGSGAVVNDMLVNFVPGIPANFKAGPLRHVTKAVGAIAIGYLSAMFLPKRTADQLGAGAMTVVGYNVVRDVAARFAPNLPLGEYLDSGMGEYLDPALGFYGAGLDPAGGGLTTQQFTRGTPYIDPEGNGLSAWPTGGDYDDFND